MGTFRASAQSLVRFRSNVAGTSGGGLALFGAAATLSSLRLEFERNRAGAGNGGALFAIDSEVVLATHALMVGNVAASQGGAVFTHVQSSTTALSVAVGASLVVQNNSAGTNGGGAATFSTRWTVDGTIRFSG